MRHRGRMVALVETGEMEMDTGEWIEHDGKGMPVDGETRVHVKIGDILCDDDLPPEKASWWHEEDPEQSNWVDNGEPVSTITHYRILKEEQSK